MRATLVPIIVGTLGTVPKNLEKYWRDLKSGEEPRLYSLLKSARILRESSRPKETSCCYLNSRERPLANAGVRNRENNNNNNNNNNINNNNKSHKSKCSKLENDTHKLLWDFNIQTDHPNPGQKTRPYNNQQKKKRICKIVDYAVPADHRINLKECEKKDKYLDLARELKKPWNMKGTVVPIVIGALGTITKGVLKGLEDLEFGGGVETIQTTALLRTARILRRVLEIRGDLLSLRLL